MTKTVTVKGRVTEDLKARIDAIVAESGRKEEQVIGEAVERLVHDDYWVKETERRINRPEHERLGHDHNDMDRYVKARASGKAIAAPEAKLLSDL